MNIKGFITKYAPTALTLAGIGAMGYAAYSAVKKTYNEHDKIQRSAEISTKPLFLLENYGKEIGIFAIGATATFSSHVMLMKRVTAIGSLLTAELATNALYKEEIKEARSSIEDPETLERLAERDAERKNQSPWSVFFDEGSKYYTDDRDANEEFLFKIEQEANDILYERGWITMAEVYRMLGLDYRLWDEYSYIDSNIGWNNDPDKIYQISFGITDLDNQLNQASNEPVFYLDFNVEGFIN